MIAFLVLSFSSFRLNVDMGIFTAARAFQVFQASDRAGIHSLWHTARRAAVPGGSIGDHGRRASSCNRFAAVPATWWGG